MASWWRFHLVASWLQSHDESSLIAGRSGHDRIAIVNHDHESQSIAVVRSDQVRWAIRSRDQSSPRSSSVR